MRQRPTLLLRCPTSLSGHPLPATLPACFLVDLVSTLPPPRFEKPVRALFCCVLLFFAGFYFYGPCLCCLLSLSMDASLATVAEARECMCLAINFTVFKIPFEGQGGWDGAGCCCFDAFDKRQHAFILLHAFKGRRFREKPRRG